MIAYEHLAFLINHAASNHCEILQTRIVGKDLLVAERFTDIDAYGLLIVSLHDPEENYETVESFAGLQGLMAAFNTYEGRET